MKATFTPWVRTIKQVYEIKHTRHIPIYFPWRKWVHLRDQ